MVFTATGHYPIEHLAFLKEHSLFLPTTAEDINIFTMIVFAAVQMPRSLSHCSSKQEDYSVQLSCERLWPTKIYTQLPHKAKLQMRKPGLSLHRILQQSQCSVLGCQVYIYKGR